MLSIPLNNSYTNSHLPPMETKIRTKKIEIKSKSPYSFVALFLPIASCQTHMAIGSGICVGDTNTATDLAVQARRRQRPNTATNPAIRTRRPTRPWIPAVRIFAMATLRNHESRLRPPSSPSKLTLSTHDVTTSTQQYLAVFTLLAKR